MFEMIYEFVYLWKGINRFLYFILFEFADFLYSMRLFM